MEEGTAAVRNAASLALLGFVSIFLSPCYSHIGWEFGIGRDGCPAAARQYCTLVDLGSIVNREESLA